MILNMEKNILIIDDERDLCRLLQSYLLRKGYEVRIAHSLQAGMLLVKEINPHIILLDNNLPDGFGLNYLREIKLVDNNNRLIFISAMTNLKNEALSLGADEFLEKPITFHKLVEAITNLVVLVS